VNTAASKSARNVILCVLAAGLIGVSAPAMAASNEETNLGYNSAETVGEAQGILKYLGHLRTGTFKRGVVDAATRGALEAFQVSHSLRPNGRIDGETMTQLLQHQPATVGGPLVLKGVRFDPGSAQLRPASLPDLDRVARSLRMNPHVVIGIAGHADSTGTSAINKRLSMARAGAVRAYLISKGVPPSRLEIRGYGSRRPVADNDTRVGRAENRRVDLARFS
jgi:outer membrane protein OmpA-like peptidoglycan-associated protein